MELQRLHVGARLSETAIFNGVVYLAGQVPDDASEDISGQTRQVLAHVERLLLEAGSDKSRILTCQIFLREISHITAMNAVWDAWVVPGATPPRATVEARMADPDWLIEIIVSAAQH
ncbi:MULTISPECIES: RidA family protein [unclassified Undibacterium]|uniref:RidA family protein n=1 Tax=unclassified Undibacterium TaxID=2630295 RepID=UPI002AC9864A|nr:MULTISPECIES: RidA family protein [unclassified Undibacterium]MEB0139604.1 RidA family protein [Undibacterium sp. CCC2.1]MEB0171960.1 RidA family protein [Undibacterium sp. CCC1.1]MEB0176273.1 RidA family protein [Undibacterium sp. CCC3.4]MEB0213955.1 RidA family protein [Undibacterium sp. 5I2]WPX43571.1 RidA family protein [Undibacterium sp. CCC3.4]